jgi:hypothetical protein
MKNGCVVLVLQDPRLEGVSGTLSEIVPFSGIRSGTSPGKLLAAKTPSEMNRIDLLL